MTKNLLLITLLLCKQIGSAQSKNIGIDTTLTINIGGIQQVLKLIGTDISKPVLLYLHGASGNNYSLIDNAGKLTSKLQEHFLVALWDQRDYGKTFALNKSPGPLSLDLIVSDTKEAIDFLLKKFNRKKLYLVGHSMGCVEGIFIADKYPELLYALVEISPPVNGIESQKIGLSILKTHFAKVGNKRAINELSRIKLPARDFESLFLKYIWQSEYDGEHISDTVRAEMQPMMKKWMESPAASLSNEIFEMDFNKRFPSLKCPVYFFAGRKDFVTNSTLAEKYYNKLHAPKKHLFWFEKSAHGIPDTEPELMQNIIINQVLANHRR